MINVYVANLGKYTEGELVGKWIALPATEEEIKDTLKAIGINEYYEEYAIHDYESEVIGVEISEHASLEEANNLAKTLANAEDYEVKQAAALIEGGYYNSFIEALDNLDNHTFIEAEGGYNEEESLAYSVIDDLYGGIEALADNTLITYFDADKFGRDLTFDLSVITEDMEEEEAEELYNMDNEELAFWYIEGVGSASELGRNTLESYFDYEGYGRDMMLEGVYIASNGIAIL